MRGVDVALQKTQQDESSYLKIISVIAREMYSLFKHCI